MTDTELQEIIRAGQVQIWREHVAALRDMLDRALRAAHSPIAGLLLDRVIEQLPEARERHRRMIGNE